MSDPLHKEFCLTSQEVIANLNRFILANNSEKSPLRVIVTNKEKRTTAQNAAQYPYLVGFSEQLLWPVNGEMTRLTADEYKDILTCAFEKEVNPRLAAGFDGGVVMLGRRTSKFGKKKFSEWYEWLMAAAALKGVTPVYKSPHIAHEYVDEQKEN